MRRIAVATVLCLLAGSAAATPIAAKAGHVMTGCRFNPLDLSFGQYDVFDPSPTPMTGTLTWTCGKKHDDVELALSPGDSQNYRDRYMTNTLDPTQHLHYQIFLDREYEQKWGNGFDDTSHVDIEKDEDEGNVRVFGIVFPRQDVKVGRYSDDLELIVNY